YPSGLAQLFVQHRFAGDPARREGQDDEMPFDPSLGVAGDHLAMSGEPDRVDGEGGLLENLAFHRLQQRLAELHGATRQGEKALGGRARPAHNQNAILADDRATHPRIGPYRVGPRIDHAQRLMSASTAACGTPVSGRSPSMLRPLMIAPARATSGLSMPTPSRARAAAAVALRSRRRASRVAVRMAFMFSTT